MKFFMSNTNNETMNPQESNLPEGLKLLQQPTSKDDRADVYFSSIKSNIQQDEIERLKRDIVEKKESLYQLKDIHLETNVNSGQVAMTLNEVSKRMKEIFRVEYEIRLLQQELKIKEEIFTQYYGK